MKRISSDAYQALGDALSSIFWFKRPFQSYLRAALRDSPELLAGLNFDEPKRMVSDALVGRLVSDETRYKELTLALMLEVSSMTSFPDVEQIKDEADRRLRLDAARRSVARLKDLTADYAKDLSEKERLLAETSAQRAQDEARKRFSDELDQLRRRFGTLQDDADHQRRGRDLEALLTDLFVLFDMQPRLSYVLETEQIDGSLTFDTDDYIVEAKWLQEPASRGEVDIFAEKVRRKGKNALGLFVSVSGLSRDAISRYEESTPFVAMDGADLYVVLDQRMRLDDLLKAKKRHANETGSCYLPASSIL
jgi:hypothetical protein